MKKTSLALIISSLLTLPVFAQETENLQQMLSDRNIEGIEKVIATDPKNGEAYLMAAIYYGMDDKSSGAKKDTQQQVEFLKKSADLGFAEGQLQYGFYLLNQGQADEGLSYLNASVAQNHVKAMTLLGDLYFAGYQDGSGNSVIQVDADKSIEYLNQAIAKDSKDARYTLGYLYLDDKLGKQDISKAIELFDANIDYKNQTGDLSSILALMEIYLANPKIENAQGKVIDLYYLASLQGYVPSFYPIGMMQKEGVKGDQLEIAKDLESAFNNLSKAAQAGYLDAMFRIGEMYFKGEGTKQSDLDAYIWMSIAEELSSSNDKYSETILELIPKKERQVAIDKKNHQRQFFTGAVEKTADNVENK